MCCSIAVDATTPTAAKVTLNGTRFADQTWYILINSGESAFAYGFKVTGALESIAEIGSNLAGDINADTEAGFAAIVDGGTLYIVDPAGRATRAGR